MLHPNLINPKSIVVIGGSDNLHSPGGKVLKNLITTNFNGNLFVVNPKNDVVQNIRSYKNTIDIPNVDLAIIAIPAKFIPETVKILCQQKNTKGFIIFSAGFSEKDSHGAMLEQKIVKLINSSGASLLGPNNIGLINQNYTGVFTSPIPKLDPNGVDFISGSGATAVFIMEAAHSIGLTFNSIYSVGNSAQVGIEEILEYFDQTFDYKQSALVKILYIESIKNPVKFLKHSASLIKKGCKIAAIKAGNSKEGNRAASSHTGALATSKVFVDALFKKAGIIRCSGRNELIHVAGILKQNISAGKNIAIITHAGGPAVMLTDILSSKGLKIPEIKGKESEQLLASLFEGSSVSNPIDFLATGNAEQLETIIDYCENKFDNIDSIVIIFGNPGLNSVDDAYAVLNQKIKNGNKPIYAVLPSVVNAKDAIIRFIKNGNIAFSDEVLFGNAMAKVYNNTKPEPNSNTAETPNTNDIKKIINHAKKGYLDQKQAIKLLNLAGIDFVKTYDVHKESELQVIGKSLKYPVVLKVVGPLHKSDVGGVILNIKNKNELIKSFNKLIQQKNVSSVLIQPMISGLEIFIGAKKEGEFSPIVMCGLGGVFIEIIKDINSAMVPVSLQTAKNMIKNLKAYPILKGHRGQPGINLEKFAAYICEVSYLLHIAPDISELDINPLIAMGSDIIAVDVRIKVEDVRLMT